MLPIRLQNTLTCGGYINRTYIALDSGLLRIHMWHRGNCIPLSGPRSSTPQQLALNLGFHDHRAFITCRCMPQKCDRATEPLDNAHLQPETTHRKALREPVFLPSFYDFVLLDSIHNFSAIEPRLQRQQLATKTSVGLFRLICGGDSRSSRRTASLHRIMPSYEQLILLSASGCACLETSKPEFVGTYPRHLRVAYRFAPHIQR
jgi:hypothetical protein